MIPMLLAVRNLYLRPDAPEPAADNFHGGADASPGVLRGGAAASVVTDLHGGDADAGGVDHEMMVLFLVLLQLVKFVVWLKIMLFYVPYV